MKSKVNSDVFCQTLEKFVGNETATSQEFFDHYNNNAPAENKVTLEEFQQFLGLFVTFVKVTDELQKLNTGNFNGHNP